MPDREHKRKGFSWRKDWPWIALATIAVGSFFLFHPASPIGPAKTPKPKRGMAARGRERYATARDQGLANDGGSVS